VELLIRPYQPADFDAVTILWRIAREVSLPEFQRTKGHHFFEDRGYFRDVILQNNRVWVAESGGVVVAFMAIRDDFVDDLYVHPEYWRRGVGSAFLKHAQTLSPEHVWLYTLQINSSARAFYEKHGFVAGKMGISPPPESEPDVQYHWRPEP
jgi:GNAT superfamily N-acetyltransferase